MRFINFQLITQFQELTISLLAISLMATMVCLPYKLGLATWTGTLGNIHGCIQPSFLKDHQKFGSKMKDWVPNRSQHGDSKLLWKYTHNETPYVPKIFYNSLMDKRCGRITFHTLKLIRNNFSQKVGVCFAFFVVFLLFVALVVVLFWFGFFMGGVFWWGFCFLGFLFDFFFVFFIFFCFSKKSLVPQSFE